MEKHLQIFRNNKLEQTPLRTEKTAATNIGLPAVLLRGGKSGAFALDLTFVLSISICTKFELLCFDCPPERKSIKRYQQA